MKPISTLSINGESFEICDPNAVTAQQLEERLADMVQAVIDQLPVYAGEVV